MRKTLIFILLTFFVGMSLLLSQPQIRHIIFTGLTQFPEFATMQAMKGGLITREFDRVLPWLNRQYQLANYYGREKNKMTPGLLENIKKAYDVAVLREERERFIPILESAYELNPNNIDLNIMLASAYQYLDSEKAMIYLNKARTILPSDRRIFQLANLILHRSKNITMRKSWCESYLNAQFGDYEEYKNSTLLGVGYRRLAFEYDDNNSRNIILNEGLTLGEKTKYEFLFDKLAVINSPSLRISNGGGIEVFFDSIQLYSQGRLMESYSNDLIKLFPETGFISENKVISTNKKGENIFLVLPGISKHKIDKVILELSITKLKLDNTKICES